MHIHVLSGCNKLPTSWTGVTTDVTFPVKFGAKVTVKCSDGYYNSGDDEVTCDGNTNYKYTSEPTCWEGLILVTCFIFVNTHSILSLSVHTFYFFMDYFVVGEIFLYSFCLITTLVFDTKL